METSVIIQVICNGLFLFKLPSDCGFFQEKASILMESVKTSTAIVVSVEKISNSKKSDLIWPNSRVKYKALREALCLAKP